MILITYLYIYKVIIINREKKISKLFYAMHYLFIDSYIFKNWFTFPKKKKKHLISIITRLGCKNNRSIYNLQRDFEIERILITFKRFRHVKMLARDYISIKNWIISKLYNNRFLCGCVTQIPRIVTTSALVFVRRFVIIFQDCVSVKRRKYARNVFVMSLQNYNSRWSRYIAGSSAGRRNSHSRTRDMKFVCYESRMCPEKYTIRNL